MRESMTPFSASRLIRVLLALFASHVAAFAQGKSALVLAQLATVPHVPNEVLVQYRAGATPPKSPPRLPASPVRVTPTS